MKARRFLLFTTIVVVTGLTACGKSRQLKSLLPGAPGGWKTEKTEAADRNGAHAATAYYVPEGGAPSPIGASRVAVQILQLDSGATIEQAGDVVLERQAAFKSQTTFLGFRAMQSFPLPSDNQQSLDIFPAKGAYVEVVVFGDGSEQWQKSGDARITLAQDFARRVDLNKVAALGK